MSDLDPRIGRNLAKLRGEMRQADLAKAMKDRGWKWSQATVWSIETGERPLRLAEAIDVMAILNILGGPEVLAREDEYTQVRAQLHATFAAHERLVTAVAEFMRAQTELALSADLALAAGVEGDRGTGVGLESWLGTSVEEFARQAATDPEDPMTEEDLERLKAANASGGREAHWLNILLETNYSMERSSGAADGDVER